MEQRGPKQQRVNHIAHDENSEKQQEQEYQAVAESDIDNEDELQELNFLDIIPYYRL